jgi:hypothetical protein
MKKTLLFVLLATTSLGFAQSQIIGYYGFINDDFGTGDGTGSRSYSRVASAVPLDQTAAGANSTWNFTQLSQIGSSWYHNVAPTAAQGLLYPETTRVVENSVTINSETTMSKAYFNGWIFTGVENADFTINYTDDGTFYSDAALDYGDTHTESIGGTYTYDEYVGTFTGTITGTVDAYGTLNLGDPGWGATSDAVTRLKIVQSLVLEYPGFGIVGTADFTSYHYYRANDLYPYFTSKTSDFNIPVLAIDEIDTVLEAATPGFLGLPATRQQAILIAPNPVHDILKIQAPDVSLEAISVSDINGRIVMKANPSQRQLDLSAFSTGIYFLRIDSPAGTLTRKIIKN